MKIIKSVGLKVLAGVVAVAGLLASSTPARADVTVSPQTINLGTVAVGTRSAPVVVTLTNSNNRRTVFFNGAWISSSRFIYSGPTGTFALRPDQSIRVSVSFRPDAAQAYSGTLIFRRANGSRIAVSLSGTGSGAPAQVPPTTTPTTPPPPPPPPTTPPPPPTTQITTAPVITSQPFSRSVMAGQTASFTITAGGTTPSFQWRKNGSAISGATSSSFTTAATTMSDSGEQFSCTVSNTAGSVTSSAATLTVNTSVVAPSITSQPASRTVIAGQTASFSVGASGTAPFTYQWTRNGSAISGANASSYTTPVATSSDNGAQFAVVVSNSADAATSSAATLTVSAATLLLSSNTGSLSFGDVETGSSAMQQVTLSNKGNGNVTLSGMSFAGAGFTGSGVSSGQILTPGQTVTLSVTFKPAATGTVTGAVTVTSNAASVVVNLTGAGVEATLHTTMLSWTRSTSTVNGYMVYSSQVSGGPYSRLTNSAITLPSYSDSSVQSGKTYYYVVTAVDGTGMESQYSNQVAAAIQ